MISVGLGVALHEVDTLLPFDTSKFPIDDLLAVALLVRPSGQSFYPLPSPSFAPRVDAGLALLLTVAWNRPPPSVQVWFGVRTLQGANNFTDKANEEREEAEGVVEVSGW